MLEEGGVVRIVFAMIVWACTGDGEVDESEALAVFGSLDFTPRRFDGADDGIDVGVRT